MMDLRTVKRYAKLAFKDFKSATRIKKEDVEKQSQQEEEAERKIISTRTDIQLFTHGAIWADIVAAVEDRFIDAIVGLVQVDPKNAPQVAALQAQIEEMDHLLHLPERLIIELEEQDGAEQG